MLAGGAMEAMPAKECQHENLAHNGAAHVQRCADCGCISIHMGPVTVRFDDYGLEALWSVLGDACAVLHERYARITPPRGPRGGA